MRFFPRLLAGAALVWAGCGGNKATTPAGKNPDAAPVESIDRFSSSAGTLMVRDAANGLPAANAPIDFDQPPFLTQSFGRDGRVVRYYNFDVQPTIPAPLYVLYREGESAPVAGQLDIVDAIPGEQGYNDFWQVVNVTVPAGYVANRATSADDLVAGGFPMIRTPSLVNAPIVPAGSVARSRLNGGKAGLERAWYDDKVAYYFTFLEQSISLDASGQVPTSPIYVTFQINPGQTGGGPPSGFVTESGGVQTHNVASTLPGDAGYSPLWAVQIYDNAAFPVVHDLASALAAPRLVTGAANVNCPIVYIAP